VLKVKNNFAHGKSKDGQQITLDEQ